MKPIQLHISGLNSFREKTAVDFDRLMLGGLFGIFGPTGSGKSTILDAMTLALYGKVRRAPGGTGGIVNVREPQCSVSFTFEIGSNGGRHRYTVDRVLARNKTGGIETKRMRLLRHTDGVPVPIAEKKHELKERISDIVGITAEDFLRAVVLPQGAFAEFLGLEARERGAVLQRLFGLYDLGDRLNSLLKERAAALTSARAEMEGQLQQLRAYDDAALAAAEQGAEQAAEEQNVVRQRLEALQKKHQDAVLLRGQIEEYQRLVEESAAREGRERTLNEVRERIELAERSRSVTPAIEIYRLALQRFEESQQRYREAVAANDGLQDKLSAARERLEGASLHYPSRYDALAAELEVLARVEEEGRRMLEKRGRLRELESELATVTGRCEEMGRVRDRATLLVKELDEEIALLEKEFRELSISNEERRQFEEWNHALRDLENLRAESERKGTELQGVTGEIEKREIDLQAGIERESKARMELEHLESERERLKGRDEEMQAERQELLNRYMVLQKTLVEVEAIEKSSLQQREKLAKLDTSAEGSRGMLKELESRLGEALSLEFMHCRERDGIVLLREEARQRTALVSLAGHLHDGSPCPLCGSVDHPVPFGTADAGSAEIAELDHHLARLDVKVRETQQCVREIEQSMAGARTGLESTELEIENCRALLDADRAAELDLLRAIETGSATASPPGSIDELRALVEQVKAKGQQAKNVLDGIVVERAAIDRRIAEAQSIVVDTAEHRARIEAELKTRQAHLLDLETAHHELCGRLQVVTKALAERSNGKTAGELENALLEIRERERKLEDLRGAIDSRREDLKRENDNLSRLEGDLREQERVRDRVEGEYRSLDGEIARMNVELSEKLAEVVPEAEREIPVERLISGRRQERDHVRKEFEEAKGHYDRVVAEGMVTREKVDNYWKELCREELARDEADRTCQASLRQEGFTSVAHALSVALPPDELRRQQALMDQIEEELAGAIRRMEELRITIGGRDISTSELAQLEQEVEEAKQDDDRAVKALGGAQERLRECRQKNAEWRNVCAQDLMSLESTATVDQLSKYLRGNAFIDFLANERLSDICRHASVQLTSLTGGRLELGARPKDGFYIRDNGNGGTERSPSSLSGGETFLVSLSLALALSETIQLGRSPLEFFFLDEGFGTLDNDLLETVMNSLERIRSEHRAIGVISHVAQLRERIPRRLIVSPASDKKGSTVHYEVA